MGLRSRSANVASKRARYGSTLSSAFLRQNLTFTRFACAGQVTKTIATLLSSRRCTTNRWTGATGSDFRIKRDLAKLLASAVARSTPPFDGFALELAMPADALEFLSWLIDGLGGWRYLLSRSFRQRTHERWRLEGWTSALAGILFGGLALVFTLLLLGLLAFFLLGLLLG